jgi:hypothetical protein
MFRIATNPSRATNVTGQSGLPYPPKRSSFSIDFIWWSTQKRFVPLEGKMMIPHGMHLQVTYLQALLGG